MTLIDEVKELKDWCTEDDFDAGDIELDILDQMFAVLYKFQPGDAEELQLMVEEIAIDETEESYAINHDRLNSLIRWQAMAALMEEARP